MPDLRSSHTDARQRAAVSKANMVDYMMNQTLQYEPGKSLTAYVAKIHSHLLNASHRPRY